ncbi:MAG: TonB-dependent receptor [Alphaproteobacteria bacterium]|nr:TonB-dependent receptor [Alphaproteobacteria bacterium]
MHSRVSATVSARTWERKLFAVTAVVAFGTAAFALPASARNSDTIPRIVQFDIRGLPLQQALLEYSEQAGVQIILPAAMATSNVRRRLVGERDIVAALQTLLDGTGFEFHFSGRNTVVVRASTVLAREVEEVVLAEPAHVDEKAVVEATPRPREDEDVILEELVTIGTRNPGRTVTETAVPVDVIGSSSLRRNGYTQTGRLLQALAPSFNFAETTISDGTDIVRPATLRGLGPDQVLVLVNGKRRHNQSWVNVQNTVGKGAVGTDMNTIPINAIKRVEILRDGAAAQYGSDAIAGVVNIVLKDYDDGFSATAKWGQTYKGDGDSYAVSSSIGLPLPSGGFLNLTGEYQSSAATNRADPSSLTDTVVMRIGETDVEATALSWNMGLWGNASKELYAFGGLMERNGLSGGFYRHIHQAPRSVPQLYPQGFLPLQRTDVQDFNQAIGFRFSDTNGWNYDLSATYGRARFAFGAENTVNVSLASEAYYAGDDPSENAITSGNSGALQFEQLTANLDVAGATEIGRSPVNLAFGFEYRLEDYEIKAGDTASYACGHVNGDLAPSILDATVTAVCGFQGFPGYSPGVAGSKSRSSVALYIDSEFEPAEDWFVTAAVRFENYERTGSKLTGKLSSRHQVSEQVALRTALSTGFRAPALAQRAFTSVITNTSAEGLTQTLVAPEGHEIPAAYGVDQLHHESNTNISLGLVWTPSDQMRVTLDAYQIDIDDRIVLGPTLPIPDGIDLGAIEAGSFFSNGIDTLTRGIDLVACYKHPLAGGELDLTGSVSWNKTTIQNINAPVGVSEDVFFPYAERVNVEKSQPRLRASVSADYTRNAFGMVMRVNFYGNTESAFYTPFGNNIPDAVAANDYGLAIERTTSPGTAAIVDLEFSYDLSDSMTIAFGANNLFDKFPDELEDNAMSRWISDGRAPGAFGNFRYPWVVMPWGIMGGYYYARMSFEF